MRFTAFTAVFFFALLALFSTLAYAAPVPQGAMLEGRQCDMSECRNASPTTDTTTPPASDPASQFNAIISLIKQLIGVMGNSNVPPPTVVTSSDSSSAPAPTPSPTGKPQPVLTIRWFTEIAIPSPTLIA